MDGDKDRWGQGWMGTRTSGDKDRGGTRTGRDRDGWGQGQMGMGTGGDRDGHKAFTTVLMRSQVSI
jgi:hypothetical protein